MFAGSMVAMCDCCYPRSDLLETLRVSRALLVLDHHISSKIECGDLGFCEFDMERSGAAMAWDFFHPGKPRPPLISHVQDRDLHRFALPQTSFFCAKLDSLEQSFKAWAPICSQSPSEVDKFTMEGEAFHATFEESAQKLSASATPVLYQGLRAFSVNAPGKFASRCGSILLAKQGCQLVVVWSMDSPGFVKISYRSASDSTVDTTALAAVHGGGGHIHASGARMSVEQLGQVCRPSNWHNAETSSL